MPPVARGTVCSGVWDHATSPAAARRDRATLPAVTLDSPTPGLTLMLELHDQRITRLTWTPDAIVRLREEMLLNPGREPSHNHLNGSHPGSELSPLRSHLLADRKTIPQPAHLHRSSRLTVRFERLVLPPPRKGADHLGREEVRESHWGPGGHRGRSKAGVRR